MFSSAQFRWWITGGHALDLHCGRTWRRHEDTDLGLLRRDLGAFYATMEDWDLHVAADGQLAAWGGEPLDVVRYQNNLWCRRTPGEPWTLDVTISEGAEQHWIYRRHPSLQVPWDQAVLHTTSGIPYLAPELQLLYKSKGLRPKDEVDAAEVIPTLSARQRELLSRSLAPAHPWQHLLT